MIGRFENCIRDMNGVYHVTFTTKDDAGAVYDEYNGKDVEITVSKPRKKRSLDANAYCWELCGKIADKMSDDGIITTKEDVYRESIKQVGVWRDIEMPTKGVETLRTAWERQGVGWVTEQIDLLHDKDGYLIRCYYGSSLYNTKQMSRLISNLIQDCDNLGIDHRTPEEINNMLSLWEQGKDK